MIGASVTVGVLGPLEVHRAGRIVPVPSAKQRALLTLLVMRPDHYATGSWLADALWDGAAPDGAGMTLRSHIAGLRRALEPERAPGGPPSLLTSRGGGYQLRLDPDATDLARFTRLARQAATALAAGDATRAEASFTSAGRLWRGDPLPDVAELTAIRPEMERLRDLHVQVQEGRLSAAVLAGRHAVVLADLRAFVASHPLREQARAQLMLALYRSGRQAEALAIFTEGRRLLADEFGVDPGEHLRHLHQQILRQDPALDLPARPAVSAMDTERPLVGRTRELGLLREAVSAATSGAGRVAVVVGEAGVGKTSLATEVAAGAADQGVRVIWARCPAVGQAPPFWLWAQIVRELATGPSSPGDALAAFGTQTPEPAAGADPAARFRLYEAVARLLGEAAAERGLLLALDDLHAADPDSLLLLRYLGTAFARTRVLVLATSRPYAPDSALTAAAAELARTPGFLRIDLSGLDSRDVAALVRRRTGVEPTTSAVATLLRRTGGNPFFLTELLTEPVRRGAGEQLPPTIRDAVALRLSAVPAATRRCLEVLAVAGDDAEIRLLAEVLGEPVTAVAETLAAAYAENLVVEAGAGRTRFAHPLFAEVAYALPAPSRRAALHGWLAGAYERLGVAAPAEIARHYGHAAGLGHGDDHLRWLLRAADDAARRLAYEDATAHLDAAAGKLRSMPGAEGRELAVQLQRAALLQVTVGIGSEAVNAACVRARTLLPWAEPVAELPSARWMLGELAANRAEYAICRELAEPLTGHHDELFRAAGHYLLGSTGYFLGRLAEAEAHLSTSADLLSTMDPARLRQEVARRPALAAYNFRALVRSLRGDPVGAAADLDAASALAEMLDDPYGRANAWLYAAWRQLHEMNANAGRAAGQRCRDLGEAQGMPHFVAIGGLFEALAGVGDEGGATRLRTAYETLYRLGLRATRTVTLGAMANAHLAVGDLAGAARLAAEGLQVAAATGERVAVAELLRVRAVATGERTGLAEAAAVAADQGATLLIERIATS